MTSNVTRSSQIFPTLPPRLSGRLMGRLCVKVDEVLWSQKSPGDVIVLVKWWGEFAHTEFRPVDISKNSLFDAPNTVLVYNLRSSLDVVESYLKEVKSLKLIVIDAHKRCIVGYVTIPNVTAVLFENPFEKYFPIRNTYGNTIGELHFGLKISYKNKCGKLKTIVPYLKSRKLVSKLVKKSGLKPSTSVQNDEENENDSMSEPETTRLCQSTGRIAPPRKVLLSNILEKSHVLRKSIVNDNNFSSDEHVPFTNTNNNESSETNNPLATLGMCIHKRGQAGGHKVSVTENSTGTRASTSREQENEDRPNSTGTNSEADILPNTKDSSTEQKMEGVQNRQSINLLSYANCMKITCKSLMLNNVGLRKVWVSNQTSSCRSVIQRKARSYLPEILQNAQVQPPGATYFVEYEFPHILSTGKPNKKQRNIVCRPWAIKMHRFCSNRLVGNLIQFEQSCIHKVSQTRGNLQENLKSATIVLSLFSRHLNQRLPTFIGKAQVQLLDLCQRRFLSQVLNVPILFSSGLHKCKVHLGSITVKIELGVDKIHFGPGFVRCIKFRLMEEMSVDSLSTFLDASGDRGPPPVTTVATSTTDLPKQVANILQQDILLQGSIKISSGRNFDMSRLYLLSRAFWKDDAIISDISYEAEFQNFNFHELMPVLLSTSLLVRCRNNFLVTEVRKRNRNGADYLIGMVKLPLHQFYISYRDPTVAEKLLKIKYPVIAVDGWLNVTDPISQNPVGQLKVLLALGTEDQVKSLEQSRLREIIPNYRDPINSHENHRDMSESIQKQGTSVQPSCLERERYRKNKKNARNSGASHHEQGTGVELSYSPESIKKYREPVENHENKDASEENSHPDTGTHKLKSTASARKQRQLSILRAHFRSGKIVKTTQPPENRVSDSDSTISVKLRSRGVQTDITMARVQTFGEISQALTPKVQVKQNLSKQLHSTMSQTDLINLPGNRFDNQLNAAKQGADNHVGKPTGTRPSMKLSDNDTGIQLASSNQLSDICSGNQRGTCYHVADQSDVINTGNQLGDINQLSESFMASTAERTNGIETQPDASIKVPANHVVTVHTSAIDNLLDTSKQLSSGLITLPLSDNVQAPPSTLTLSPKEHNPRMSRRGNEMTTCYLEVPCEPIVIKNPPFFKAHIEIENALHLPGIISDCRRRRTETDPGTVDIGTYVTFQLDPGCDNIMYTSINEMKATHIVHDTVNPSWNWHCDTIIPHFLLTDVSKRLVFKVWQSDGASKCSDTVRDSVLGFAAVDLTVLLYGLPWVSGWFNIVDFTGRCNGQIKINITPLENLARFKISNSNELYQCERVNGNVATYEHNPLSRGGGDEGTDDPMSSSFLSKALKEKFSELDDITIRLKQRLQVVTSDDDISHVQEEKTSVIYSNPVARVSQSPATKTSSMDVQYQSSHTQTQDCVPRDSTMNEPCRDGPRQIECSRPDDERQIKSSRPDEERQIKSSRPDDERQIKSSQPDDERQIECSRPDDERQIECSRTDDERQIECSRTDDEDGDVDDFDVLTDYLMESAAREIELEKVFNAAITKSEELQDDGNPNKSPPPQPPFANDQTRSLFVLQTSGVDDEAISVADHCESAKKLHREIVSQLSGLENRFVRVGASRVAVHPTQCCGYETIPSLSGSLPDPEDSRPSPVGGNLSEVNSSAHGSGSQTKLSKDQKSVVMNKEEVHRLAQIFSTKLDEP